jgi:hypothetical protein
MYKFNQETLMWEDDPRFKNLLAIFLVVLCTLFFLLSFTIKKTETLEQVSLESKKKDTCIYRLSAIPKDSVEEYQFFRQSLGTKINPSPKEEGRLKELYFKYRSLINAYKVPHNLLWYISFKESRLNPKADNKQSSAKGMFQFIDGTWKSMCKKGGLDNKNRLNESQQVEVMCVYLNYLYDKYGNWERVHNEYVGGVKHYHLPKLTYLK